MITETDKGCYENFLNCFCGAHCKMRFGYTAGIDAAYKHRYNIEGKKRILTAEERFTVYV